VYFLAFGFGGGLIVGAGIVGHCAYSCFCCGRRGNCAEGVWLGICTDTVGLSSTVVYSTWIFRSERGIVTWDSLSVGYRCTHDT
jgi:hypothetical protein